jgi:chitinase
MKKNNSEINKVTNRVAPAGRRLSLWRLLLAVFLLSGLLYSAAAYGLNKWRRQQQEAVVTVIPLSKPWFAAYVDVTAVPTYNFEQIGANNMPQVVLSFIVSSPKDACMPSWGVYYTPDQASVAIDLDRRIARLQQQGGRIAVSFGGMLNSELALGCKEEDKLLAAYKLVIERYNIDTIDLDLEGQSLRDTESAARRAVVIAKLQEEYRIQGKNLAVWLTLPVAPQGLTEEGTNAVSIMLSKGVDLAGVNVMTMDYGASKQPEETMFEASKQSLIETHRQLGILYKQAGINLNSQSLWRKLGATPMVGQNDIVDEIFTLEDAEALNAFAAGQGLGRMSMWSANRDIPCGENYVDVKVVSPACSGVKTSQFGFSKALQKGFDGDLAQSAGILTIEDPESNVPIIDDPEKSPYQIWQETGAYPKGVKVVWHGNVYEAKWWTKNDLPDNPVLQAWQTPWQLIGPVLPDEKPIKQPKLPAGTYPKWSGEVVYDGGDRVLFEGTPFQAKWWNQGESPAASTANPDTSPWIPLTQAQITEILSELENDQED